MNRMQTSSIEAIRRHLNQRLTHHSEQYGAAVTHWEIRGSETGSQLVFVSAQVELLALGECNLLRALSHDYYHFYVGPRGKIEMLSGPRSYEQFKGRRVFGFTVKSV